MRIASDQSCPETDVDIRRDREIHARIPITVGYTYADETEEKGWVSTSSDGQTLSFQRRESREGQAEEERS